MLVQDPHYLDRRGIAKRRPMVSTDLTPIPPCYIDLLPPEVLHAISDSIEGTSDLRRLALISRAWRIPAQMSLWSSIRIESGHRVRSMGASQYMSMYQVSCVEVVWSSEVAEGIHEVLSKLRGTIELNVGHTKALSSVRPTQRLLMVPGMKGEFHRAAWSKS